MRPLLNLLLFVCINSNCTGQQFQLNEIIEHCIYPIGGINEFGGVHSVLPHKLKQLPNGNFIGVGSWQGDSIGAKQNHGFIIQSGGDTIWTKDAYIIITDMNFIPRKANIFGGIPGSISGTPYDDGGAVFHDCFPQKDGGYVLFGSSQTQSGDFAGLNPYGFFFFKVDSNLQKVWCKGYSCLSQTVSGRSPIQTKDGGYLIAGINNGLCGDIPTFYDSSPFTYDNMAIKFDSNGNKLWAKVYGSSSGDNAGGIVEDKLGNIYLMITSGGRDHDLNVDNLGWNTAQQDDYIHDINILKMDSLGNKLWSRSYGTTKHDAGFIILFDSLTNRIIVGGWTKGDDNMFSGQPCYDDQPGNGDAIVMSLDTSGNIIYFKRISGEKSEQIQNITILQNGNYLVDIYTSSKHGDFDGFIDYAAIGGSGQSSNLVCIIDTGNNYILKHGWKNFKDETGGETIESNDGYIYIREGIGQGYPSICNPDTSLPSRIVVKKYGITPLTVADIKLTNAKIKVYPNPNDGSMQLELDDEFVGLDKITISLFSMEGKLMRQENKVSNKLILLDYKQMKTGNYLLRLKSHKLKNLTFKISISNF